MGSLNPQQQSHKNLLGHKIADGRLELISVLGLGAYGVVYLARDLTHPIHKNVPFASTSSSDMPHVLASRHGGAVSGYYAVKCLNKVDLDSRQKKFQRREIVLHTMVTNHPSVVSLYRVIDNKDDSRIYVILDYCPDGDLFSMITEKQRYAVPTSESDEEDVDSDEEYQLARAEMDITVKKVFLQLLDAVEYCHVNGIYHRDLKPENILCLQDGAKVVLADFGLATHEKDSNDFGCGSTFYMGPECQGGISNNIKMYNTAANDIWSLGVILVNLICGRNPWKQACLSDETFREYLRNPDFLMDILPISQQSNALLKRIFTIRESWRCSLAELRSMIHQITRFTATNAELRERQKEIRCAAQRQKEEAIRAKQAADAARREAELRHGVDHHYRNNEVSLNLRRPTSTHESGVYSEEDVADEEQLEDAYEEAEQVYDSNQEWEPIDEHTLEDREDCDPVYIEDTQEVFHARHDRFSEGTPSTPCAVRTIHHRPSSMTTPTSSYSPTSCKSSEFYSTPDSPLESDSEMTPESSYSRSRSGDGSRRSSSPSYSGLPPTPGRIENQRDQARLDIHCNLQSLAIQSLTEDGDHLPAKHLDRSVYYPNDTSPHGKTVKNNHFLNHNSRQTHAEDPRFRTLPAKRSTQSNPQREYNARNLSNDVFGA
ncbi:hypothetical protein CBS101457_002378 [Exobasidium rhododendri]|nr:hypothetical protein CBS101457_002378 [Exobasidium rhododendri]